VELVVPGSAISSTSLGGQYKLSSGMSMVTPFVTGATALLLGSDERAWSDTEMVHGDGSWTNDEVFCAARQKILERRRYGQHVWVRPAQPAFPCRAAKTSTSSSSRRQVIIQYHIWRRVQDYAFIFYIS
jgi:hypothetical protein